ncbi:hypothetical protein GQ55_2G087700 [Panicum hallii var. hallii]|uniref:Uncharacterized protein n=1 Tax=Panicum hallii var. hallii TaxID=1504633 RepID=A0A2T7EMX0_9POAL|nr:hypothetical protein GQ55_2G087700 [Panicum hallii var. hallii]
MLTFFEPSNGPASCSSDQRAGSGLALAHLSPTVPPNSSGRDPAVPNQPSPPPLLSPHGGGDAAARKERVRLFLHDPPPPPRPARAPHRALSAGQGRLRASFRRSGARRLPGPPTAKGFRLSRPPPSSSSPSSSALEDRRGEGIHPGLDRPLLHLVRNPNLAWLLGRIAPRPVRRDLSCAATREP